MVASIIFNGFLTGQIDGLKKVEVLRLSSNIALVKVLFPVVVYVSTRSISQDISLALVLLASVPAAGVSPSLIRLLEGDASLAAKILLSESVASCLTVPLLFSLFYGTQHAVSSVELGKYFSMVLLLPLILAWIIRKIVGQNAIATFAPAGSALSVVLIVTLVSAIAAKISPDLLANPFKSLALVAIASVAVLVFGLVSIFLNRPKSKAEAITFMIKNNYINIGLSLGIATSYFNQQVAMTLLAYVIAVNLLPRAMAKVATSLSQRSALR